jgi:glycosyltransferase involved in cell wall biosynthesis
LSKKKIQYFYTAESPFVEKDIQILQEQFDLQRFRFNLYDKRRLVLTFFKQLGFLISGTFSVKIVVCQFAGMHSFFPVLFAKLTFKKCVIVAGGTDCVSFPSINYGNFTDDKNAFITRFCFKNCSLILPVHESLVQYDYTYQDKDYPKQGIKYFVPGLKTKIITIYNGYNSSFWNGEGIKEKNSFVTVLGHLNSRFTIQLKGIDLYISLAFKFPEAIFTIIGGSGIKPDVVPPNLKLLPNIWGQDLVRVFATQRFYVQLSMSEGFPNALCEAMLCKCVPIVSVVGAMPMIIGNTGYLLHRKDEQLLTELVKSALSSEDLEIRGTAARERVKTEYTFEKRRVKLLAAIKGIL